jgi:hypothetical protein
LLAIESADTVVADATVIEQQAQETELTLLALEKAKSKYNDVKYFVQKAFPNSLATQNEFGLNDYQKVRRDPVQMVRFLDQLSKACLRYQVQLLDIGYNPVAIAEIEIIRKELLTTKSTQGTLKKERPKLTEDRIIILNTCYNYIVQLNQAAQRVYKDDFAKQNQFVFSNAISATTIDFEGIIAANSLSNVGTLAYSEDHIFSFSNSGTTPLIFCLSTTQNIEGIEVPLSSGESLSKPANELNANGTFLLVKNTHASLQGEYRITVD